MLRFFFKIGLCFLDRQTRRYIRRRLATGKIQLESEAGEIITLTDSELHQYWLTNKWVIDESTLGSQKDAIYLTIPRDLSTYPEKDQKTAKYRYHYLQQINPEVNRYSAERWHPLILEASVLIEDDSPPSPSAVQEWWRRYRATKCITALIPHSRPSTGPRKRPSYLIYEEVVAASLLTNQKLPRLRVVEEMYRRIDAVNNGRAQDERTDKPARSTIYRWIEELNQDLVDKAREGAEAARMKYQASIGTVKVDAILLRIEIDHTPLDLIVIDKVTGLPLGRPWLTMAIDRFSRLIMGFYISFNAPSSHAVLQCLRRVILPKEEWLSRFPGIKNNWPAHGIPALIAVDNGMELHAEALESACKEMGIEILYSGSKTPQHKGAIERFFRTLNEGLIHTLPGTVFSSVDERGDYPAEDKAVIDMETLVLLLTRWIVDVYNVTSHRGIGMRPLDKWLESADHSIIELPVHPQQLEVIAGIPAKRTLFHYGIELEGLQYNSELLQTIRRRTGENKPVSLKFYEDTVAHIHVFDPYSKEYIQVPAKLVEYAEGLPREIHRLVRESARKRFGDHVLSAQLLEAKAEIEELIKEALKAKKMGSRKGGARSVMHDSESVLQGGDPLADAQRPVRDGKQASPDDLPPGLDDDLPDFGAGQEGVKK